VYPEKNNINLGVSEMKNYVDSQKSIIEIITKVLIVLFLFSLILFANTNIPNTNSYFTDSKQSDYFPTKLSE
jgi:preprotein translocase subunit SecG